MSVQWIAWVLEHSTVRGTKRLVLLSLANHADENGSCWPSLDTIAKEARVSRRRAEDAVRLLVADGVLERKVNAAPVARHGGYRPNLYRILKTAPEPEGQDETSPPQSSGPDNSGPPNSVAPDETGPPETSGLGVDDSRVEAPPNRPGKPSVEPSRKPSTPPTPPATPLALVGSNGSSPPATGSDVQRVFDVWRQATDKHRARLDRKREKAIRAALRDYPVDDVLDAVQGWQHSPHHRGENDRRTVYNSLELLLRDADHIEMFRDLQRNPPERRNGRRPRSADALDRVVADMEGAS